MRINATERTRATSKSKAKGNSTRGGTFVPQNNNTSQSAGPAATARTSPVVSIDTLIALQESDDFRQARKTATARADELLDVLSDLRLGLLEGAIPRRALNRLSATLERTRANTGDSRLESILNEVEVRAEVEKAKLDSAF
jgi:Class II flagellar assembly regulator